MSDSIICPRCGHPFEVAGALAAQVEHRVRSQLEAELAPLRAALTEDQRRLSEEQVRLRRAEQELDGRVQSRVDAERVKIREEERQQISREQAVRTLDLQRRIAEKEQHLLLAQQAELNWLAREREWKQKIDESELRIGRMVNEQVDQVRNDARLKAAEELQLKVAEKDKLIGDLRQQMEQLQRRAEQGSQQAQGEALEIALESLLRDRFPHDRIEEVPKGIAGGDLLQHVRTPAGHECGAILWETKRTRTWSDGWLPKLRNDQRQARAAIAVLATTALPSHVSTFEHIDGVWVSSWSCALSVAAALRAGMLELAKARTALDGQAHKQEQVYQYLTSPPFRHRIAGTAEALVHLQADFAAEKRAVQRQWAKREKQIDQALSSLVGLYGDFQGLVGGGALPEIRGMTMLEAPDASAE